MADAKRDNNNVTTLIGVSSADGITPVVIWVDPVTHRVLVDTGAGGGDVVGPASSTDNAIARFDSTTGKLLQNSGVTISDTNVILVPSLTASEILITNASKEIVSAAVATYPSLAELIYLKGVTSAIQTQLNAKAPTASPTFTGTVTIPQTPSNDTDAASKGYVDSVAQGLSIKESVQVATAAALPANTYSNGASGVGATLTAVAVGVLTVDGVAVALNDRVLVKNEVTAANNGIYLCTVAGTAGVAYVLTRSLNMNQASEIPGAFTFVENGTANDGAGFVVADAGPFTIGTTAINWTQFSGAGQITAGNGLSKSGNTLSIDTTITQDLGSAQTVTGIKSYSAAINEAKGADIASATTTNIGAATGNYVVVTGTVTITGLGTVQAGTRRIVKFSGILTLTHNATSLILPSAANITTAADDTATFISLGSGNWVCTSYQRKDGTALVTAAGGDVYAQTSKPTTYWTYQIPITSSTADQTGVLATWGASSIDTTVTYANLGFATFNSNGTNGIIYIQLAPEPGSTGETGAGFNCKRFSNSKKTVVSFLYKKGPSGNFCWGIYNGTNAALYDPADTGSHSAVFTFDGTNLNGKTSNGSAKTVSSNITGITTTDWNMYRIEFDPTSAARFYVNGTLQATVTGTLPSSGNINFGVGFSASGQRFGFASPIVSIEL